MMIRLNEYIDIKTYPENYILETSSNGKSFWQRIKKWFNSLFSSDENDPYDFNRWDDRWNRRYYNRDKDNKNNGDKTTIKAPNNEERKKYEEYLNKNFNKKHLKFVFLPQEEGRNCIEPNGLEPDEKNKEGFYKFINLNTSRKMSYHEYAGYFYDDKSKIKDCAALVCFHLSDKNENVIILRQFQILDIFQKHITLKELINDVFINFIKKSNKFNKAKEIHYLSKYDEENFNNLIKDCGFEEKYNDKTDTSYCSKSI